jgi:hypothetical protein
LTVDLRGLTVAAGAVWIDGDEWMRHRRAVLVGRETELTALRHLLDPGSLVTVVGPGGVGKTRLALAAADDVQVPEPVVCELAGVTDPEQVAGAVGEALGFPSLRVALVGLAETERLLVLDNCEHLLDAVAEVAELLLQDCPRVAILATSREPLAVPGEHVLRLHPLALPATDDPTGIQTSPAVQLFFTRASAAGASGVLDGETAAFEARDDCDRALVAGWWQAHEAGERPVIYAHRRVQVDQLNAVCQRLRAEAGQLGPERLVVGDGSFAVGDVVVLGANAKDRLGVVNGTTAVIQELDLRGRAMTLRTLEEEQPRTVRLPGWYLDAPVRPGQSRRVDLAYARTDMRSQGRTERRALLALDGAEDMQGGYVQLTRSTQRTDLYLTVGPEPLGPDDERPIGPGRGGRPRSCWPRC